MEPEEDESLIAENNAVNNSEGNNPNLSNDLNADENVRLKGDAIGNTMYSERFVLRTLLRLAKIEWNEDLENDLSSLWDMTTESDVVKFLLENNFIEVSAEVIRQTEEVRLIEIMIGIIGNMCCSTEVCAKLYEFEDIDAFLSVINLVDTPSLVQLMRVIKGIMYNENENYNMVLNTNVLTQINFILKSSQNTELLLQTMEVVAEIIDKRIFEVLRDVDFLESTTEAFKQIIENTGGNADSLITKDHENLFTCYLKIVQNYNIFCSELSDDDKYDDISLKLQPHFVKTVECFELVLLFIDLSVLESNLEIIDFYLIAIAEFLMINNVPFQPKILLHMVRIFDVIVSHKVEIEDNLRLELVEFLCYSISRAENNELKKCLESMNKDKLVFVLKDNLLEKHKCEDDVVSKINDVCNL